MSCVARSAAGRDATVLPQRRVPRRMCFRSRDPRDVSAVRPHGARPLRQDRLRLYRLQG